MSSKTMTDSSPNSGKKLLSKEWLIEQKSLRSEERV